MSFKDWSSKQKSPEAAKPAAAAKTAAPAATQPVKAPAPKN